MSNKGLAYLTHHFLPDCVTTDFARYFAIVPMSLIPPTFFAESGFFATYDTPSLIL